MNFPTDKWCFLRALARCAKPMLKAALMISSIGETLPADYGEQVELALPELINLVSSEAVLKAYFRETAHYQLEPKVLFFRLDPFEEVKMNSTWKKKLVDLLIDM